MAAQSPLQKSAIPAPESVDDALRELKPSILVHVIASSVDVILWLDAGGVIQRARAVGSRTLADMPDRWIGRPWRETVTHDSVEKIDALLSDVTEASDKWRQVNHPTDIPNRPLPVRYLAFEAGVGGAHIAIGRDMSDDAVLQQRLVEAHRGAEQGFERLRHAESRYRRIFHSSEDAILIVESSTQRIADANPAAAALFAAASDRMVGSPLAKHVADADVQALRETLAAARAAGESGPITVRIARGAASVRLRVGFLRQGRDGQFVLHAQPEETSSARGAGLNGRDGAGAFLGPILESWPDGCVVAGPDLRIHWANAAFLELVHAASVDQVIGAPLNGFIGRSEVDARVLVGHLKDNGAIRSFAGVVRSMFGGMEDVEIDALALDGPNWVFLVRPSQFDAAGAAASGEREIVQSPTQLTHLVGRVSLKQIVRETTDVIERLCIETALDLTGDNRASAAEMLGLSRQSLYQKLRRHGIGDLD